METFLLVEVLSLWWIFIVDKDDFFYKPTTHEYYIYAQSVYYDSIPRFTSRPQSHAK